jgi:FKBP-type peptidyl-prolyl cis-trans isomerase SlyD
MIAAKDTVVHISYVLRDAKGEILDESTAADSFEYLQGHENIVPGLEKALSGKSAGEKIKVSLTPDEGYGDFDPALIRKVPKSEFPPRMRNSKPGEMLQIQDDGVWRVWRIDRIEGDTIVLDGNHELAGQDLHFEVEIHGVRAATPEEIEHGHAHSPGHHHH